MLTTTLSEGPPFPCLRVLVPPLRLVSAAIWQTVQRRMVTAYGFLDDLITEITEIVPGLLNRRQRCLLCLNLRAQLVLDLCRPGQTIDMNALQPHLDRMQTLSLMLSTEVNNSAVEGASGPNMLMSLIQRLITDPDNRQHFYQDVFPQKYGPKYCKAVELLVMKFLVTLERLLVVPNLQQVASMLGSAPSILEECVELPLPQELKSLLEYQKDCFQPNNIDVCLPVGDGVCTTAPPLHSTETILIQEETLLKANMLDYFCSDYMDTSGRERTVEMSTAESASVGFDTKDNISGADGQPGKVNSRKDVACNIQKTAPSHRLNVELDSCAVELPLGCNIEVPECMGHTDTAQPPEEDTPPPVTTGEDEQVKLSVKMDGYSTSEGQSCAGINMEKENKNQHLRNTCKSDVAPALILAIVGAPSPTPTNEETPAPSDLAIRPARKNRGLKMKRFLTIAAKTVSKDLLASKTCRTCGKTYSRSSDMRRHQRTHTGERLFRCPRCKKYFQFRHDLRRHISSSCHVAGLQSGVESPQALEDQTARDQSQSCTSSAQPTEMSNQVKTAPCPRGTGHSDSQGTRSLRSLEECSSLGKEIPLAAVQTPTQPNQAVVEGRLESTLLQVDIEDGCQGKQNQPLQGSTPAAESAMPIVDILLEAASFEGRTDEEPQLIKTTDAKEINSPVCLSVVKETPRSHQRAPLHSPPLACPNCEVKFKSKSALKRHMVKSCKVEKMALEEADAAIQRFKTQKENRMGRKCTGESKEADSTFHCAECDMSFPDTTRLVAHNVIHKPRPCTMCDQTFNGVLEVNQHYIDVHHFLGPFPCALCDRVFPGLKGLIRHERVHTSELPLQSPKCPKASGLKLHDRTPTKEALFLCWDCGKGCRSNGALRIHRLCHHGSTEDKCFSCEHCGKSYALKHSLDLHVAKLHTGVRYPCAHCGKLFRSASSLTRHDLMHTQERPFSCRECGKSFRSASELKVHARYHTGERPFKCQECGKGFVQSYYLTVHTRTHSGEKPYPCPTCDKCFKSAGTLKRHRLTHTGEKPHNCSVCEMAFSRHQLLKSHVTKLHNK